MEVDSAQYASMSREMLEGASLTELTEHGQRYQSQGYPDKPPLIFWAGALGMRLLGSNEAGFRLMSWLAAALALWAVGKWARLLWGSMAVLPTRLVYASNLGMLLINVDLRTDSLLLSMTTIALWQGQAFMRHRGIRALLGFTLALALALMAKGPIAAVAVVVGLLPSWPAVEKIRKSSILSESKHSTRPILILPALLLVVLGVFLLLSPMLWGLYRQWGWHDGVRYYLWTQSFGRITGENPWANQTGPLFLTGSLAWSFLPWTLVLIAALFRAIRSFKSEKWSYAGIGALAGLILLTIALSSSAYQLPHYIYIVWPFASVLCAKYLSEFPLSRKLFLSHNVMLVLLLLACVILCVLTAANPILTLTAGVIWLFIALVIIRTSFEGLSLFLARSVAVYLLITATLLLVFYPNVLPYQASVRAGQIHRSNHSDDPLWILGCRDESLHSLHFYARRVVSVAENPSALPSGPIWVYTDTGGRENLNHFGRTIDFSITLPFTRVSALKPDFFHPRKRENVIENRYLIHVQSIFVPAHP